MNVVLKTKLTIAKENVTDIINKIELQEQKISYQDKIVDNLNIRLNNDIHKIQEEIKEYTEQEKILLEEVSTLQTKRDSMFENINIDSARKSLRDNDQAISQSSFKILDSEKEIKFYEKTDTCPKCKTQLSESMKAENITNLNDNIKSLEDTINDLTDVKSGHELVIKKYDENIRNIKSIDDEIKELNISLRQLNSERAFKNKYLQESTKIELDLAKEKTTLKAEKDSFVRLKREREDLKEDLTYYKLAGDILKDNGVKIKIIKHYLPAMNKYINKYLRAMDFFVQFNIDEEFNEVIKSRHRDEFSYMNFSEGEKMRIDLALLLAWREVAKLKNSVNCNLLILDEIFDSSLDSVGTDEVLRLLNALGTKTNVFVISHKADQILDKFTNSITFEKKNNFSKILAP